jgi:hypothetical protein
MATTVQLINKMEMSAEGWNRVGEKGLIGILNEAQNILLFQESAQRIVYRTDGELPYIATTDQVFKYDLNKTVLGLVDQDIDIWMVSNVLVKEDYRYEFDYGTNRNLRQPTRAMEFNGIEYFKFHQAQFIEARHGLNPTLKFSTNPGDTTKDFYLLCYEKPKQITAETINPEIPEQYHYTILLPTALKLLEAHQNGNWLEVLEMIEKRFKPMMADKLNEGDQGEWDSITRHEY